MAAMNKINIGSDWLREYGATPNLTSGAKAYQVTDQCWHLEIPSGPEGRYRLSQLDDYSRLSRIAFPWSPPVLISLRARASHENIPGTWGLGLWNDPFSLSLGFGGGTRRFPVLPNAAWFFFASEHNYLSLRDDIPATGNLAATFQSKPVFAPLLALGALGLPLIALSPFVRQLRHLGRHFLKQDAAKLAIEVTEWHHYEIEWNSERVIFRVDNQLVFQTATSPFGPLGMVIWIDNQYAALPPNRKLAYGTLANTEPTWIEIDHLTTTRELSK